MNCSHGIYKWRHPFPKSAIFVNLRWGSTFGFQRSYTRPFKERNDCRRDMLDRHFFFTILYFWDHTYWCLMCSLFCVWTQKDVEHGIHGSLRCIFVVSGWNRTTYLHVLVVENFLLKLIFVGQTNICWEFKVGEDFCLVWTLFIWSRKKDIRFEHLAQVLFLK